MPFLPGGCPPGIYAGLARLSAGCPPDRGRLHTCYSPVRRSPAGGAGSSPAAARLACVKPAASVHPEPGSNSPLLVYIAIYLSCFVFVLTRCYLAGRNRFDGESSASGRFPLSHFSCLVAMFSMVSFASGPVSQVRGVSRLRMQSYVILVPVSRGCSLFVRQAGYFAG